jgi:hypothetical protein
VEELVLQLNANHKEEEGKQRVRRPRLHGQIKVQRFGAKSEFTDCVIRPSKRRVCQDKPRTCRGKDQPAAHRFILEEVGNTPSLAGCG